MTPDPIALTAGLNQNCNLFRGEDKILSINMTGYDLATVMSFNWWMATSPYALVALLEKSLSSGIAVNGTNVDITIAAADTVDIVPEIYYHELRITLSDGSSKVALAGNIVVRMSLNVESVP